jgi:2-polyprenyl-3-methyl-5-hydroxy-6-metoxy-1,4-benzoquinol methylase
MASQEIFEQCYRGRQTALHHMAYMRVAKVLLTQQMLDRAQLSLEGKSVFDYGFGAGTFFRYCPSSAALSGVEMDAENVAEVAAMLNARGFAKVDLQTIALDTWRAHPLLKRRYDLIVCSHVLEHLDDPVALLSGLRDALSTEGRIVALVPINERSENPHHVQRVDRSVVKQWANAAALELDGYVEADPWIYWLQPLYATHERWKHLLAQLVSLGLGVPASLMGHRAWARLSSLAAVLTRSRPTQAAFIFR